MIKSKFIELYQTFNSPQLEALRKWVNSPMHNRHQDVVKLIDFLIQKPKLTARTVQKEKAFKQLYPKRTFDDLRLRHIMTLAVHCLEEFISFSQYPKDDFQKTLDLVAYCHSNKRHQLAAKYCRKLQRSLDSKQISHSRQHLHYYWLYKAMLSQVPHKRISRQQCKKHQVQYIIIEAIKESLHDRLFELAAPDEDLAKTDYLSTLTEAAPADSSWLTKTYIGLYALSKQLDHEHIDHFLVQYREHYIHFDLSENKNIISLLLQILTISIDLDLTHSNLLLHIYEDGLQQGFLMNNTGLSPNYYWDILSITLATKGHAAAANFVNKYTELLEKEIIVGYNRCARAYLLLAKGAYKSAILILKPKAPTTDTQILCLQLQLKIYFENNQFEKLDKKIRQLRRLIDKSTNPNILKQLNFCSVLEDCADNIRLQKNSLNLSLGMQLLAKPLRLSDKLWFIQQLKQYL